MDNPQLEIEGRLAWRINNLTPICQIEPFSGEPKLGELAVTTASMWTFHHQGWIRNEAVGADIVVAMLRMWLGAKEAWDIRQRELLDKIEELQLQSGEYKAELERERRRRDHPF